MEVKLQEVTDSLFRVIDSGGRLVCAEGEWLVTIRSRFVIDTYAREHDCLSRHGAQRHDPSYCCGCTTVWKGNEVRTKVIVGVEYIIVMYNTVRKTKITQSRLCTSEVR